MAPITFSAPQETEMKKLRAIYCHPSADLYGSDRMALETVAALLEDGWDVKVVLPNGGVLVEKFREIGVQVSVNEFPVLRKSSMHPRSIIPFLMGAVKACVQIQRLIRRDHPDLVYINTVVQPWWILGSRLNKVPCIVHVREAENQIPSIVKKMLAAPLALATKVICNSAATKMEIDKHCRPVRKKSEVVYNGKDWQKYFISDSLQHERTDSFTMIVVGRLSPRKGQDLAILALNELISKGVNATLILVGDTFVGYEWFEAELRTLAIDYGLSERVLFQGFVEDIAPLLAHADVVLVPSRVEPFGTVAAEALAAGTPVVVARVQGLIEIVHSEKIGYVFEVGDFKDLSRKCHAVQTNPEIAKRTAENGRKFVFKTFSQTNYFLKIKNAAKQATESAAR